MDFATILREQPPSCGEPRDSECEKIAVEPKVSIAQMPDFMHRARFPFSGGGFRLILIFQIG
jgi:hypothetical protein